MLADIVRDFATNRALRLVSSAAWPFARRVSIFALATLIAVVTSIAGAEAPARVHRFVTRRGGHTARLVLRTGSFRPADHRILHASKEYELKHQIERPANAPPLVLKIDGREPLGTDQTLPRTEIESMIATIDGTQVEVPKALFADCFEPNLGKKYFAIRLSDDYKTLFVFMDGSDAAGSYNIIWVIPRKGEPTRFSGACPDCGFIDFRSGFFQ